MKRESLASTSSMVLIGLGILSWTATATGFFKLAVGDDAFSLGTVFVGLVAAGLSAAIQVLMVLFFFRAAQPSQISPTRWLFVIGCAACMVASITLGISSYMDALNINKAKSTTELMLDSSTVETQQGYAVSFLEDKELRLGQVSSELRKVAADEGQGTCGPICGDYLGMATRVDQEIVTVEAALNKLEENWIEVQAASEAARSDLLRKHQALMVGELTSAKGESLAKEANVFLDNPQTAQSDRNNATRARAQTFIAQLRAITSISETPHPEMPTLGTPMATGAVADVEIAINVIRKVFTGNISELDDKEKMALILASMVDVFIVLVMIWQVQSKSRLETTNIGVHEVFIGSVTMCNRLAQNAGFDDIVEGIKAIEAAGQGAFGMPGILGHIVRVQVPRSNAKLNDLMVNLKNAGLALTLPITFKQTQSHGSDVSRDQRLFWVPASAWRELEAVKTLIITSPKLSDHMTFGEFVDWVCSQPENAGIGGNAKTIRSTIARNFPFAWPVNMKTMSQARIEDILESFERTATVSDKTKKSYRRVFKDMLAIATHKGLLPVDRSAADLKLVV